MSEPQLSADQVADFLQSNPSFFQDHAGLFAGLSVPHPHEHRAISLGERQILALRARVKDLEWRLAHLVHNAGSNEKINRRLTDWCALMLAENDPARLPAYLLETLTDIFELPEVALRLWNSGADDPELTEAATEGAQDYIGQLAKPYCGPADQQPVLAWFHSTTASLAVIPLRHPDTHQLFGAIALGAHEAGRFTPDMDTTFLETLGQLAGAALSRLSPGTSSDGNENAG
ncbi:MAG: DUF484 family protein [Burkholderiaceae bacterium]